MDSCKSMQQIFLQGLRNAWVSGHTQMAVSMTQCMSRLVHGASLLRRLQRPTKQVVIEQLVHGICTKKFCLVHVCSGTATSGHKLHKP